VWLILIQKRVMTGYFESLCVVDSDTEESDDWIL